MRHLLLATGLLLGLAAPAAAQTVIISQYVETNSGTTPKGIEVWNPTDTAIDLAATPLTVLQGTNGAAPSTVLATINTGTLSAGGVIVVGTSDMSDDVGLARFVSCNCQFNGDDSVQLRLNNIPVDTFGNPGQDPGSEWAANGVSTANQNIQIREGIYTANVAGFTDPSIRYETVSTNPTGAGGLAGFGIAPPPPPPAEVTVTQELTFTTPGVPTTAAGWRHLSPPVAGFDMADLAELNLVQGVPAGEINTQAQYEGFASNVYVGYGASGFLVADDMDHEFNSGEGFLWYLYDNTRGPYDGGTSQSYELDGFELSATGATVTADWLMPFTDYLGGDPGASRFYMIGNPFALPLATTGISISSGTIQAGLVQVYNPDPSTGGPGYVDLSVNDPGDFLAVWQGAFIEVASAGDQTVTYDWESTDENADPAFYGKTVADAISFRLDGALASGATTADGAAHVRFNDAATPGWDIHDASKLTPPLSSYALVAPSLVRDGEAYRVAVSAVPAQAATIPVAFTTTGAGTFTLSWTAALPSGLTGTLRDLVTGTVVDLGAGSYAFTAEAGAWSDRFEIVVTGNVVAGEDTPEAALTVGAVRPNPTVGTSSVRVSAPAGETVTVRVYDALGREVAVAYEGAVAAGGLDVALPTAALAPGAYVVRVEGATASAVRRLTVLR